MKYLLHALFTSCLFSCGFNLVFASELSFVNIEWTGQGSYNWCSLDILTQEGRTSCIDKTFVKNFESFRFDGSCYNSQNGLSLYKIEAFEAFCSLEESEFSRSISLRVPFDHKSPKIFFDFSQISPNSNSKTLTWDTLAQQSEYSLDIEILDDNGITIIRNCVKAEILGQRTSYEFDGTCPNQPQIGDVWSKVTKFIINSAEYGDWSFSHGRRTTSSENKPGDIGLLFPSNVVDTFVYILAGQSNMVGYGEFKKEHLKIHPESHHLPDNVEYISNGKQYFGFNEPPNEIEVSEGIDFIFGPEVTFAYEISRKYPGKKIILLKYAVGGSSIERWLRYDGLLDELTQSAIHFLKNRNFSIKAFIWMQGEADAKKGNRYYLEDLRELRKTVRSRVSGESSKSLPFVVGRIFNYYGNSNGIRFTSGEDSQVIVRKSQEQFIFEDSFTYGISTDAFILRTRPNGSVDPWHFNGLSQLSFGKCFFQVLENLEAGHHCKLLGFSPYVQQ